ncbi:GIY-YIG nuclease family protein [Streptomyces kaempferi]
MTGADRTALYRLYDEAGQLLYVGITTYPPKRFVEHERDKPWWSQVVRRDVEWVESRVKAETAERCAIAAEQPRYNRIHNIGRPIAAGPSPEAAEVFARFKGHYEARRGLEPEMLESADRALKAAPPSASSPRGPGSPLRCSAAGLAPSAWSGRGRRP